MDIRHIAEHLHDDIVELCFSVGYYSHDQSVKRRFFEAVYLIGFQRLCQATNTDAISEERARWMQQLKRQSQS